ncbi:hypothetical protein CLAFUW4_05989 [Fulvia fulva]|uniref:Uncharacterized protein n=1 Tax=Passalora fulva TaxID=5499 RepID=A0A9Q8P8J1_PASFU|nr:uncharacterized protein CLAFUR5_06133 [Fulvia fulva]KAK4623881.1 hypothetical protein CLAFUR4_05994 [Fulvia fulva]KAK4625958.1 hypothetical protein CLAFUR0_05997 [Fulvia fulva]UJO17280.1 hypothetical protein CLAFUR5_06133 [Fulvia fulva]WPV14876.1 hypothetical protein CLAFUW4_05989 [Fulvia fulva]WPV29720.1 hypothetical protein CLAFUW7_05987 [Fulvia fulva]
MKGFLSAVAFAGLAAAQQMNIAAINDAPLPATTVAPVGAAGQSSIAYNTAAAATSISAEAQPASAPSSSNKVRRGDCSPQPAGSYPQVKPDTAEAFVNYPPFHALANSQGPPFPYFEKFRDLNGSTQQSSYLTYMILKQYDVNQCARLCDNADLCTSFNIYVERDPTLDPGPACPNPPSTTNIKCVLWGSSINRQTATNTGQYRQDFHVVIAASNGYDKTFFARPSSVDTFTLGQNITGKAITLAGSKSLGSEFFAGPYDPTLCGYYATAQTSANRQDAQAKGLKSYQACNSFNAYAVYRAGLAWGTYCSL